VPASGGQVPVEWLESNEPSYILYTSGTTGKPKGVQRDVGGYAVALAASMKYNFCGNAGETFFATSDIGWVVGHSYIVYGPLIAGMATIMYEAADLPDPGIWWSIVEKYKVTRMFSADRDPRAAQAGAGIHAQARQVVAEGAVSGRRAAR
jgi:propionyl-CoA synthetase